MRLAAPFLVVAIAGYLPSSTVIAEEATSSKASSKSARKSSTSAKSAPRPEANPDPRVPPSKAPPTKAPTSKTPPTETPSAKVPRSATKSTPGNGEWRSWLGPNSNGTSAEKGLLHAFPEDGPTILWRAPLGTGFSAIAVGGGRVFTLYGDAEREYAVGFDALTGKEAWKVDLDRDFAEGRSHGPRAMPCLDGDRVYVLGASGRLLCLVAATGRTVWSKDMIESFGLRRHEEGLSPTPLVDGKKLIVLGGSHVFALDKLSGDLLWKALDEPMNHASPIIATLEDRRQLLILSGRNLIGLSPEDGTEYWRHPQEAVNIATPVVGPEDRVFSGAAYGFGCQLVQIEGGRARQLYKNSVLGSHTGTPVLHEGQLYGCHDRLGILKCVDFATGKERWVAREAGKGNLIIADGQIILINEEGELILAPASPDGFRPTARARILKGTCFTAPSLAAGRLYLRSDAEMVCVLVKA